MNEMNQNLPPTLRSAMDTFYTAPQPDPAFAEKLEAKLRQRQIELMMADPAAASSKRKPGSLHLPHRNSFMHILRTRPFLAVVAAILALLLLFSIGYAIYRVASDPGLLSVQDAGLVKNIGITAQPTIFPTPTAGSTRSAASVGMAQSINGVTLTVDWVYLDEGHFLLGLKSGKLPEGIALGTPTVTFENTTPAEVQGSSFYENGETAVYASYQRFETSMAGDKVNLKLDVPLLTQSGVQQKTQGIFHFDLNDVQIITGQTVPIQQTYAVKYNGVEVRLKSVRVMPSTTEIIACYDQPTLDASVWQIQAATIQIGNGPKVGMQSSVDQPQVMGDHCVKLGFQIDNILKEDKGSTRLIFHVQKLAALDTKQELTGSWEFSVDVPQKYIVPVPGQAQPKPTATQAPLGSQTQGDVTVTLDWAFADAKRVAVGYTITGLPDEPDATALQGNGGIMELDKSLDGNVAGYDGTVERIEGQPGLLRGSNSLIFSKPLTQKEATFRFQITLGPNQFENIIASFPYHRDATPLPPGVNRPSLPDHTIGTFTFDFTVPVYPMVTLYPKQRVKANGLEMSLEQIEISPSFTQATVCYQKPSSKDWTVGGSSNQPELEFGGKAATINSYNLHYDTDLGGYIGNSIVPNNLPQYTPGRCVKIDFMLGHTNQSGTATLTIPDMTQSVPEVIPDEEIKAVQEKLKARGIEMDYSTFTSNSGGGGGVIFKTLPDGMSQKEAYQRYLEALGYVLPGPWVFTFEVHP